MSSHTCAHAGTDMRALTHVHNVTCTHSHTQIPSLMSESLPRIEAKRFTHFVQISSSGKLIAEWRKGGKRQGKRERQRGGESGGQRGGGRAKEREG